MTEDSMKIYFSMTAAEKERFRVITRKLMSQCMIVRDKNVSSRDDYMFMSKPDNYQLLVDSMDMHGYDVSIDRDAGVIRYFVTGDTAANRYMLPIRTKILLCVFLLLYIEKMSGRGFLDKYIEVRLSNVIDVLEKYRLKDRFTDSSLREGVSTLARFNLIAPRSGMQKIDYSMPVRIYPSIQFCLDEIGLKDFIDGARGLLESESAREKEAALTDLKEAIKEEDDNE